jgi:hypothetical protein
LRRIQLTKGSLNIVSSLSTVGILEVQEGLERK